jgi:soluble lytic murein transglycosylase-like protein
MAALTAAARARAALLALVLPLAVPSTAASQGLFPLASGPAPAPSATSDAATVLPSGVRRWQPYIAEASQRFGLPQTWIAAVMQTESAGQTRLDGRPITSRAGAMGLMQLMPDTWASLRRAYDLGADPYDPRDNILAGAAYLKRLYGRFGYPGLFAAYNAGPTRYAHHLRTGDPLPAETRAYMAALADLPATPDMPPAILSGTRLFFNVGDAETRPLAGTTAPEITASGAPETAPASASMPSNAPPSGGLFVARTASPGRRK